MNSTRTVLYLVPSSGLGGAETFLTHVARFKKEETPIFCCLRPGPLVDWLQKKGEKVYLYEGTFRLKSWTSLFRVWRWLAQLIKTENVDLIHSVMAYAALIGGPLSWWKGVPHVWFQHGPVRGWMTRFASRLSYKRVLVNSAYTEAAQNQFSSNASKTFRVSLGVDDDYLENSDELLAQAKELRRELLQNIEGVKDRFIVSVLARLQQGKGVHLAIEAIKHSKVLQERIELVVWGEYPDPQTPYHREIQIASDGLPIHFAGPTRDARMAMMASDVILCPSIWPETFGLVVVEGMALGKVVVAPNEGGPVELFEHEKSGLHFEPRNVEDLILQLERVVKQEVEAIELGIEARQRVNEKFRASHSIQSLENIHSEVLLKKK